MLFVFTGFKSNFPQTKSEVIGMQILFDKLLPPESQLP